MVQLALFFLGFLLLLLQLFAAFLAGVIRFGQNLFLRFIGRLGGGVLLLGHACGFAFLLRFLFLIRLRRFVAHRPPSSAPERECQCLPQAFGDYRGVGPFPGEVGRGGGPVSALSGASAGGLAGSGVSGSLPRLAAPSGRGGVGRPLHPDPQVTAKRPFFPATSPGDGKRFRGSTVTLLHPAHRQAGGPIAGWDGRDHRAPRACAAPTRSRREARSRLRSRLRDTPGWWEGCHPTRDPECPPN